MRALIIEDDQRIQQFLQSILTRLQPTIQIDVTDSAVEALAIARAKAIDFFIVDIQLVDFKGTDLVKQIRMMPAYRFTPIVFETGVATEELYAYRELKCFYYLVKPYTEVEFVQVMTDVFAFLDYADNGVDEQTLKIEQKGFLFEYYLKEIAYIESFGKKVCLHVERDGQLEEVMLSSYSLKRMLELLDKHFIQVHKSYIINREKLEKVDFAQQTLKLRSVDVAVPIGLKYQDVLK
ncbi:two component transcriptional regulator, LytTR family [Bacillus sp. OK048]|nr:two component transcriptional regulator, LytTR family [Bacillus sp. OK048]